MKLFDEIERTFLGPANHNESAYNFYNRSARKEVSIIREKLDEWFSRIQDTEKSNFKSAFIEKFDDGFYELFLHNLFLSLGFKITIHPKLKHTDKRPDFLITKGDLEIYVEAKISKDKTTEEEAFEKMKKSFCDALDRIKSLNFFIGIESIEFITGKQPNTKKIISKFEKELSELNPDIIEDKIRY